MAGLRVGGSFTHIRQVSEQHLNDSPDFLIRAGRHRFPDLCVAGHEDAWKKSFAEKRHVIRRLAREALAEDERGEMLPLDDQRATL